MQIAADPSRIDAVITWVDGADPDHLAKRRHHLGQTTQDLGENATNPHRWADNDELSFCLRSIARHAPWITRIWIVVDGRPPDLSSLPPELQSQVRIVQHGAIFAGFEAALPTFNSLAIESLLWRIEGLSDRFLYFNDDVFLTRPLSPCDVFQGSAPVLRGSWQDYRHIAKSAAARDDPALFNHFMQINAGALCGYDATRIFASAHVVHPMRRTDFAALFAAHPAEFAANVAYRFRDLAQFLPQGLYAHACLRVGAAVVQTRPDEVHIGSGQWADLSPKAARAALMACVSAETKFLCINDLPQLEALVPETRAWLGALTG